MSNTKQLSTPFFILVSIYFCLSSKMIIAVYQALPDYWKLVGTFAAFLFVVIPAAILCIRSVED